MMEQLEFEEYLEILAQREPDWDALFDAAASIITSTQGPPCHLFITEGKWQQIAYWTSQPIEDPEERKERIAWEKATYLWYFDWRYDWEEGRQLDESEEHKLYLLDKMPN